MTTMKARPTASTRSRGELVVVAIVAAIGTFLLVRTTTMEVTGTSGFLGPRFFPAVVGVLLLVLSTALAIQHLRGTKQPVEESHEDTDDAIDWRPLGIVAATLTLHVLLLEPLGWLIAGAGLFFGVSYALGGRNVLRDVGIAFVLSSAAQLGFSAGLGIALPSGILGGVV